MRFRSGGRDETVLEENGRKMRIFTELLSGQVSRGIHAGSIQKYEPPHQTETLTDHRKEEILDLLCEEYDYQGISYEVVMSSKLSLEMPCPRCKQQQKMEIQLPFGCMAERQYQIGDEIEWRANRPADQGGRPENGNVVKEVWNSCPTCRRDFWLVVSIGNDRIEKAEVDSLRAGIIPDHSTPIIEEGKIVAHRVVPKR